MTTKAKWAFLGFMCLLHFALGCVEIPMMYHGNTVSSVPVIYLQEGLSVTDRWETFDLIIDYTYIQKGESLEISGKAVLGQHYQMLYEYVLRMDTYIFFLDKDSRILETATFVNIWTGSTEGIQDFSKSYKVPAETTGISFGYSGEVYEFDSKSSFWKLPLE